MGEEKLAAKQKDPQLHSNYGSRKHGYFIHAIF